MTASKPVLNAQGEPRAFFGRKSGKSISVGQRKLFKTLLPELAIELPEAGLLDPGTLFSPTPEQLTLEIGYGGGEHLARKAAENPLTCYIGCEVFSSAIGKLLEKIDADNLSNVRLFSDDAIKLMQVLPTASIDTTYLLYPDPWPKTRHHKRRFISPTTLAALVRIIRPGGLFHFATDIEDYANWTLAHFLRTPEFIWQPGEPASWHQPFPGWQPTRYETKAREQGRMQSFYFTFLRL